MSDNWNTTLKILPSSQSGETIPARSTEEAPAYRCNFIDRSRWYTNTATPSAAPISGGDVCKYNGDEMEKTEK